METEGKVGRLLLDVVVREGAVRMEVVNHVGEFDFEGDGFAGQHLHEDLHTTTEMEGKVKGGLPLDVVDIVNCVRQFDFEGDGFTS